MDNSGSDFNKRPHPAVRVIVADEHGKVLILKRSDNQYMPGTWCLPGGKVDYGETVETACRRELAEETSLTCANTEFLFYQDSLPPSPGGMHYVNMYFKCRVTGEILLNEESSQHSWISPEDLSKYEIVFRNDEGLKRYWGIS